jgi:hypothetical protein
MCYILCTTITSVYIVSGVQGGESPIARGFRGSALEKKMVVFCIRFWVKELGLYCILYCKQCMKR